MKGKGSNGEITKKTLEGTAGKPSGNELNTKDQLGNEFERAIGKSWKGSGYDLLERWKGTLEAI